VRILVLNIRKVTIVFSLSFANFVNATTRNSLGLNHLVLFTKRDTSDEFIHFLALLISYNHGRN